MKNLNDQPAPGAMRVLDKQPALQRRSFLRGSGLGAIGITVIPAASLAAAKDVAAQQSFRHLGAATGKTLVRMARDIYPHDKLADKFYVEAVAPYDASAAKDKAEKQLLVDGVKDLDRRARERYGVPYAEVKTEDERVALLKDIEATPFFKKIQGGLVTGLYNNKKLWPLFGYEGSSWQKGGYVNRGFDDIDWL
ncbi:MAG: gluconate 2-dehydrogenase subunit 3 family protein [Acidovorax sp.]|nr:gluconate 2-dehydrogenase subunit 3 family protein [Acidovorax sp.]